MNSLRNKVQLIGNVGNDPETVELEGGSKLVKFSMATNETYKNNKGEKVTDTEWHNIVSWGRTAEFVENYVTKDKHIAIEGRLQTRSYQNKEEETRYATEVVAKEILFLTPNLEKDVNDIAVESTEVKG
ncbi:MAG: single-stranded DNA-binding protein [Bacteroidota bacterium]